MHRPAVVAMASAAIVIPGIVTVAHAQPVQSATSSRSQLVRARQWLATEDANLAKAGATVLGGRRRPNVLAPGLAAPPQYAALVPIPDADGNHKADVLDVRLNDLSDPAGAAGVTARDGETGRALWSKSWTTSGSVAVLPTRLGVNGHSGVLVAISTFAISGPTATYTVTVKALSAHTGKPYWMQSASGTIGLGGELAVPTFDGLIHDVKGPDHDILVTLDSDTTGYATSAEIFSGVDGTIDAYHDSVTSTYSNATYTAVPDLTGDGLDDVIVLQPGPSPLIEALHGHTGALSWVTSKVTLSGEDVVVNAGHLGTSSVPDVAIEDPITLGPLLYRVTVLRGSNGHVVWTRKATEIFPVRHVGAKKQPAVLLEHLVDASNATSSTMRIDLATVSATNKVLYNRQMTASVKRATDATSGGLVGTVQAIGDVQPDGATDFDVQVKAESDSATVHRKKVVDALLSGRTGALHKLGFDAGADGSLRKGRATDLLGVSHSGAAQIIVWRGSTRKRYYRRKVPGLHNLSWAWLTGLRVSGHACSDLSLATVTATWKDSLGVLTARGTRLWEVDFTANQATGGELVHYPKPKHFCI